AQKGVLIKGGKALEDLGSITTIAFDKTGTLTEGKPKLTHVIPLNNFDEKEFLQIVLEVESLSNHPLAKAIAKDIEDLHHINFKGREENIKAIQGKGIVALYDKAKVSIGNLKLMQDDGITVEDTVLAQMDSLLQNGHTAMLVAFKNEVIGNISVMDVPRESAASTLKKLTSIGIKRMIMLTGDHQNVGDSIAKQIGLTEA